MLKNQKCKIGYVYMIMYDDAKFLMEYDKFQHKINLQSFEKLKG